MARDDPERFLNTVSGGGLDGGLRSRSVRGGALAVSFEVADFVLRVGSIAILARLLVPEYFGLIGMVTAFTTIVERFKDLGLATATVQRRDITMAQVTALFWINAALGMAAMLITLALAYPLVVFYGDPRLAYITAGIATGFLASGFAVQHQALLRRRLKFMQIGVIQLTANTLSIAVAVAGALLGHEYWALVYREVSRSVFMTVGTWLACRWIPGPPRRGSDVRSLLKFGGDLTAFNLIYFFTTSMGQMVVGKVFGAASLGLYRNAYQLMLGPVSQLLYPINSVAESTLSRLQDNPDKYRQYFRTMLTFVALTLMPFVMFLTVYAEEVILVVLGAKWHEAVPYFRILGIAAFLTPISAVMSPLMVTCGHSRRLFWLGVLEAATLAPAFLVGSHWGPLGVVSAHVFSTYILFFPNLFWGVRDTPVTVRLYLGAVVWPLIGSLLTCLVLINFSALMPETKPILRILAGAAMGFAVYAGFLALIPTTRADVQILFKAISGPLGFARLRPAKTGVSR
jgi:O-antigen/teichoic acid export membrane protein